jgi:hypothetical protein
MPSIFSRIRGKDGQGKVKSKKNGGLANTAEQLPAKPKWEDAYARTSVEPEEIQELVRRCTQELKARGMSTPSDRTFAPSAPPCRSERASFPGRD